MESYELKLGRFQVVFSGIDDGDGSVSVELWKDGDLVEGREFDVADELEKILRAVNAPLWLRLILGKLGGRL
jgi:hypothetical protein